MKKNFFFILLLSTVVIISLILLILSKQSTYLPFNSLLETTVLSNQAPKEVTDIAEKEYLNWIDLIDKRTLGSFGFSTDDDLSQTKLGAPFLIYTIGIDKIKSYKSGDDITKIITTTNEWYFPINLDGQPRVLLTVSLMNNEWQAVGIGDASLAKSLYNIINKWPKAEGYENFYVVIYPANLDFILQRFNGGYEVIGLPTSLFLDYKDGEKISLDEVMIYLKNRFNDTKEQDTNGPLQFGQ